MKLRISGDAIAAAVKPYQFSMIDVISVTPRITIGDFECCAINLVCHKVLIVANKIIMVYNKLEDFINGLEPTSLVKDDTIYYDQEFFTIDIQILAVKTHAGVDNEAYKEVRELMFGARNDEEETSQ